jgi:dimethylhistidine N-methyltransferase
MAASSTDDPTAPVNHLDVFLTDTIKGLSSRKKTIPCKYFYDKRGSELFEEICEQPEYYPTRTELDIMERNVGEMAANIGQRCQLIELGSGASIKTRLLLEELERPAGYVPVDISANFLHETARELAREFPHVPVLPVAADFTSEFEVPETPLRARKKAVYFPGSTVGNFIPERVVNLLYRMSQIVGKRGGLLIGVDLKKNKSTLEAAYNDEKGVTAAFNLNILNRLQKDLNAEIDPDQFEHLAYYNETEGRIELHLVSKRNQSIRLNGDEFRLESGETIHTENSYKYDLEEFRQLALLAGFERFKVWADDRNLFSVQYFEANHTGR